MAKSKKPSALARPVLITNDALAEIVGKSKAPRTLVIKKLWDYIKSNELNEGRTILASQDDLLSAVLGRKDIDMMKMMGIISKHLEKIE